MYLNEPGHPDNAEIDVQQARAIARTLGRELLTPLGARTLFGRSAEAIRKAVRLGHVTAECDLEFTDRKTRLLRLDSALDYWGKGGDPDFDQRLNEWRSDAHLLLIGGEIWAVLHPTALVTVYYPTDPTGAM